MKLSGRLAALALLADRRSAAGAGYGAQLIDTPSREPLGARRPRLRRRRALHRSGRGLPGFRLGVKAEYSPWFHEHEGFWNLEDTDALLVRSKTGLRLPLVEQLSVSVQLNVDWERRPAPGRRSTDSALLFGINYRW